MWLLFFLLLFLLGVLWYLNEYRGGPIILAPEETPVAAKTPRPLAAQGTEAKTPREAPIEASPAPAREASPERPPQATGPAAEPPAERTAEGALQYGPRLFTPGVSLPAPRRGPPDSLLIGLNEPPAAPSSGIADPEAKTAFSMETLLRAAYLKQQNKNFSGALSDLEEASAVDPQDDRVRIKKAEILIGLGKFNEAAEAIRSVTDPGLQDDNYYYLKGEAAYFKERYIDAEQSYRKAVEIRDNEPAKRRLQELVHSSEKTVRETDHFTLTLHGGLEGLDTSDLFRAMESCYDELNSFSRVIPHSKIPIVILREQEYHYTTGAPDWSRGLYDGKIRIPVSTLRNAGSVDLRILKHELAHALIHIVTAGNCPPWLHEGIAQYVSGETASLRFSSCTEARFPFEAREHIEMEYGNALSMVDYIVSQGGIERIRQMLEKLGTGLSWQDALAKVMLKDPKMFLADFEKWCLEREPTR